MTNFSNIIRRNLRLYFRNPGQVFQPVIFFIIVVSLFPMAISPDPNLLASIAAGVIWVCALLSTLLAMENIFKPDYENGYLELVFLHSSSTSAASFAMVLSHWLVTGLPLILVSILLGLMLNLDSGAFPALIFSLLIGTPALSLMGSIGAALTVGLSRSGFLITLIIIPLYIPVLIFGVSAVNATTMGQSPATALYLLGAFTVLAATLSPFAIAAAIKLNLD